MPQDIAKFNQVFLCNACGRCYTDRAATNPVPVGGDDYLEEVYAPHKKYPNDPDLAEVVVIERGGFSRIEKLSEKGLPRAIAIGATVIDKDGNPTNDTTPLGEPFEVQPHEITDECCANHTVLVDSRTLKFCKTLSGEIRIVGAKHLE